MIEYNENTQNRATEEIFFFLNKCNKHNSQGHAHNLELIVWSDTLTQQYKD